VGTLLGSFRKSIFYIILSLVLLLSLQAGAQIFSPAREFQADSQLWVRYLKMQLKKNLCAEGSLFNTCYKLTNKECLQTVNADATWCLSQKRWPAQIAVDRDGAKQGAQIGRCVGEKMHRTYLSRFDRQSSLCAQEISK
jgi:hypothetical protein